MSHDPTEIRLLHSPDELVEVDAVLREIWGAAEPLVALELLVAIAHGGGYVAVASHDGRTVGASVGLLARHEGRLALHSHVTGLLPAARRLGVGRAIKLHQRDWALERGLETITWTFDPLVRRNAWFNVAVLGVDVVAYLPSFYGRMDDAINAGDDSDRLLVAWDLRRPIPATPRVGAGAVDPVYVPTPDDVVALRRRDPAAVAVWRRTTRTAFVEAFADERSVAGFTPGGEFVLGSAR